MATESKKTTTENKQIKVNDDTEARVVNFIANLFNPIAYMEPTVMRHNMELACVGGMSKEDRSMRIGLGNYLINHFSTFYMGLITNDVFRQAVMEAVTVEIALDEKNEDFVRETRRSMIHIKEHDAASKGDYVLDFGKYNDDFFKKFCQKLADSFTKTEEFEDAENEMITQLLDEEKIDNGFIISNFAYLFRAFAKNEIFAHYVKTVIHGVEKQIGIA